MKETRSGFPKWAPTKAIDLLNEYTDSVKRYKKDDPRQACPPMLSRLLSDPEMMRVWIGLEKSPKPFAIELFVATVCVGYQGPRGEASLSPAQHQRWREKVVKKARELADLLRGQDLDFILALKMDLSSHHSGEAFYSRFSDLLDDVSPFSELAPASAAKRTHGADARRAFFVRSITRFFLQYFGKPHRAHVARATAAAFEDPGFDERQVKRLAPMG